MSIVSEVKCPRCDRRYSGIRGRCPYCGARRAGRGKHSNNNENTKGKMIIGLLLMGVLIVAVGVLLVSSLNSKPEEGIVSPPPSTPPTDDYTIGVPGTEDEESPIDDPPPSEDVPNTDELPSPKVESVVITYAKVAIANNDFTLQHIGESIQLGIKTVPAETDERVEWISSNEEVFVVTQSGLVTATGRGIATLVVKVGDVTSEECTVRVN